MTISRVAVNNYLIKPVNNWDWIKELSPQELSELLNSFEPIPELPDYLYRHQLEMFSLGVDLKEFVFLADVGLGKTLLTLTLLDYIIRQQGSARRALICVPNTVLINHWYMQGQQHTPKLHVHELLGSSKERLHDIETVQADVFVITYAGLVAMLKKSIPNPKKKSKIEFVVDKKAVAAVAAHFDVSVYDELHRLLSWKSMTYEICSQLSQTMTYRFGLTATLLGRDPNVVWPQYNCIDLGKTFGKTLGIFRAAFFKEKINYWGGYEYTLKKDKMDVFNKFIKNRSITYKTNACNDLPDLTTVDYCVDMPKEYREYYTDVITTVITANKELVKTKNAFIRMREITSGYAGFYNQEDVDLELENKTKEFIIFTENPKLDMLEELLDQIPDDRKVIIFHVYIKTGELITQRLASLSKNSRFKHVWLYGKTKDKVKTLNEFKFGKTNILVCNVDSGGTGLDLPMANYMIIMESPVSPISHHQMLGRIQRPGQKFPMFVYNILMKNTVDEKIKDFIKQGKDYYKALIEGQTNFT